MSQKKEGTEPEKEVSMWVKQVSVDIDNGIVVFETGAEDGTHFTLLIDHRSIRGTAHGGQVWFYAHEALGDSPNIRLK